MCLQLVSDNRPVYEFIIYKQAKKKNPDSDTHIVCLASSLCPEDKAQNLLWNLP